MNKTICCGSKLYKNINLDALVDSFDIIVRNNMLLPNNNYGKRNADHQVLNCHVYRNYIEKISPDAWVKFYTSYAPVGLTKKHIRSFCEYIKVDSVNFCRFEGNNTQLMAKLLRQHNVYHTIYQELRCGFGYIAHCIDEDTKPFVIGFSLQEHDALIKQNFFKKGTGQYHDVGRETILIKRLHEANLIDATFCAIKDCLPLEIDDSLITPTATSLSILEKVFG